MPQHLLQFSSYVRTKKNKMNVKYVHFLSFKILFCFTIIFSPSLCIALSFCSFWLTVHGWCVVCIVHSIHIFIAQSQTHKHTRNVSYIALHFATTSLHMQNGYATQPYEGNIVESFPQTCIWHITHARTHTYTHTQATIPLCLLQARGWMISFVVHKL